MTESQGTPDASELVAILRKFREPKAFVACHPDDQWKVREAFALMSRSQRACFVFNVTTLCEPGKPIAGRMP